MAQAHQKFGSVIGDTAWQIMQGALNTAKIPMKYLTGERQPGDYEQAARDALEVVPYAMGGGVGAPRGALGSGPSFSGVATSRRAALQMAREGRTVPVGAHSAPSPYAYTPVERPAPAAEPIWAPTPREAAPVPSQPYSAGRGYNIVPPSEPSGSWLLVDRKGKVQPFPTQKMVEKAVPGGVARTAVALGVPAVAGGVAVTTGSGEAKAAPMAAPGGRFGAAAPEQNPYITPVMMGGEKGAATLAGPEDAPSWVKSLAPSQIGPGQPVRVAQDMAEAGHNADSIFQSTGWYRAPDGQWKWILRDDDSKLNRGAFDVRPGSPASVSRQASPTGQPVIAKRDAVPDNFTLKPSMVGATLGSVFDSPSLYQAYPELRGATIGFLDPDASAGVRASYSPHTNTVKLSRSGNSEEEIIGDLTHELQHGIQEKHGEGTFGQGGSDLDTRFYPDDFDKQAKAAREGYDAAVSAIEKAGADPDTLRSGWRVMAEGEADKYPGVMQAYSAEMRKLPEDVITQFTRAAVASDSIRRMRNDAFDKYQRLAGETEARQASEERQTGNYQLPSRMPGYAPGSEQLVDTGHGPLLRGQNFQFTPVEHDPFSAPAEAGTPMTLTPTEGDPWKFNYTEHPGDPFAQQTQMPDSSNYQLPAQQQMPLPVVPAQPIAALAPSGPSDADLKWSWGNEYAAPAPNNPAEPQNIALNITQPQDYPNYAQAY